MIKILFLIHDLGQGGAEKVLVNLVNNMDQSKFDISVLALFGGGVNEQFLSPNIKYRTIFSRTVPGNSHFMKLLSPEKLHEMYVKDHFDIEISFLEGPSARIVSGCQDKETKLVSWVHVEQRNKEKTSKAFRNIREMQDCYMRFDQTVCVSETVKQDFCSIVPVKNAIVLYNTIESKKICKLCDEKIEGISFPDKEIKLCGVGTIKKSKGFDRLLRIHLRLIQEGYSIHTYILGEGPEKKSLEEFVVIHEISDSVTFLGYQINPYKYLKKCDLFVCTSYAEGFSTAATESLIVGTPVCTVEVSGMKEMLGENNEYGVIVPNDEESLYLGIKGLLDSSDMLSYYREQANRRGKAFCTGETVQAVEDFFSSLYMEV
ncbi:MAG: glycosyltransferase [Agathobacter sp.]